MELQGDHSCCWLQERLLDFGEIALYLWLILPPSDKYFQTGNIWLSQVLLCFQLNHLPFLGRKFQAEDIRPSPASEFSESEASLIRAQAPMKPMSEVLSGTYSN